VATVLRCCRDWFEDQSLLELSPFHLSNGPIYCTKFHQNMLFLAVVFSMINSIQGVIESCTDILTTSYWLHVELGKII
jgi:hypothetical protein